MTSFMIILPLIWALAAPPPEPPAKFVFPAVKFYVSRAPTMSMIIEFDPERVYGALLLRPYESSKAIPLRTEKQRLDFATELYRMIPEDVLLQSVTTRTDRGSDTHRFTVEQQYDIGKLWESSEMQSIWETVHDAKILSVNVSVKGWTYRRREANDELRSTYGDQFIFSVSLEPKANAYTILFVDRARTVVRVDSINVYRLIPTDWDGAPSEYQSPVFHGSESQESCTACHESFEESCAVCHQSFSELKSYHPAAEDCTTCHDLSSDRESKLIVGQEYNSELCFMCHSDKQEQVETSEVVHGTASECQMCHDPHGSTQPRLLRANTRSICASCHQDDANRRHPVPTHPFEAPDERYRPGNPFTCSSCHEPHASKHSKLFRFETLPICGNCH